MREWIVKRLVVLVVLSALAEVVVLLLGTRWWVAELASHFREPQLWVTGTLALFLILLEEWRFGGGGLVFCVWLAWPLVPYWETTGEVEFGSEVREVELVFLNVKVSNEDKQAVREYLKETDADVVVLAEVDEAWAKGMKVWGSAYPVSVQELREDSFGIWFLSKLPVVEHQVRYDPRDVPSVLAQIDVGGARPLTVLGTHPVPPMSAAAAADRNAQLAWCAERAAEVDGPFVLAGDLNTTPTSPYFARLLRDGGLSDHRAGWGEGLPETWIPGVVELGLCLDHVLLNDQVRVTGWEVGPNVGSDHRPVRVTLEVPLK